MSDEQKTTESMKDFSEELEASYRVMGDGEHDTDTLLAWEKIREYMEQKTVLDLTVYEIVNKGVIVMVEGIRGFIPASRLDGKHVEDLNAWLDRPVKARIIEADMEKGKLVLSAREVIREQQREEKRRKTEDVKVGEVRKGTVESLQSYGAFVDLGDEHSRPASHFPDQYQTLEASGRSAQRRAGSHGKGNQEPGRKDRPEHARSGGRSGTGRGRGD